MLIFDNKYSIGDFAFIKTDAEQKQRLVTQISITPGGLRYCLSFVTNDSWHYEIELSKEKDVLLSAGVESKENNV